MSHPKHGRRILFPKVNEVTLDTYQVRDPRPGEILIETRVTLISPGTELAILEGRGAKQDTYYPRGAGYSHSGVVKAIGEGVTRFSVGDRVYSQSAHASHVFLPETTDTLIKFDETVPYEAVAVLGAGLVGQLALQLVRLNGAFPVVSLDRIGKRLSSATRMGADFAFDLSEMDVDEVKSVTEKNAGYDVVLDATGSGAAFPTALALARKGGRVVLLGSPHGRAVIENLFVQLAEKDLTVIGAHQPNNPTVETIRYPWAQGRERKLILDLFKHKRIDVSPLPVGIVTPDEAVEVYHRLGGKDEDMLSYLIRWSED